MKKKIVIFSGAGISRESGIKTFRDEDGTWENYNVMDVATPAGWKNNRDQVIEFYNARWEQLKTVGPNLAHELCAQLEKEYEVTVITQNVDDLHERAGSTKVIHLHGDLLHLRSTNNPKVKVKWDSPLTSECKAPDGGRLRPNVVWFGESLDWDLIEQAEREIFEADAVMIVGTSLQVEPAASLPSYTKSGCVLAYVDPSDNDYESDGENYLRVKEPATTGVQTAIDFFKERLSKTSV
jgi:NAD-dependent deacetylase